MIIDTHIHLSHNKYTGEFPYLALEDGTFVMHRGTQDELIKEMRTSGTAACIDAAIDIESNERMQAMYGQYPDFYSYTVGVHPTRTYKYITFRGDKPVAVKLRLTQRKVLDDYAKGEGVVAIGETGLDYHQERREQHRLCQMVWFISQLKLAHKYNLPLVLHIRDAFSDAICILRHYKRILHGGVCHCFYGNEKEAQAYTELGFHLGIGATLLTAYARENGLEQAIIETPLEYLLLETDGPYVKPDNIDLSRKQIQKIRNTSLILPAVAKRIAELKGGGLTADDVMRSTAENAVRLFGLKL